MSENCDVPVHVIIDLETVRQGGKYNMFSSGEVFKELFNLGFYETVYWLAKEDKKDHCKICQKDDCDNCGHNQVQVDSKKYMAALNEMSNVIKVAYILADWN